MLLNKWGAFKWFFALMRPVGQMAFTNYLAQSLVCGLIFYGVGFGLFGKLELHQVYYVVAAVWVIEIIWSHLWMRYFRFGPMEWLWRSLTYWKRQPIKKQDPQKLIQVKQDTAVPVWWGIFALSFANFHLMERVLLITILFLASIRSIAQDSLAAIEPGYETSFENTELWIIVAIGFLVLVGLYFLFRRKRRWWKELKSFWLSFFSFPLLSNFNDTILYWRSGFIQNVRGCFMGKHVI